MPVRVRQLSPRAASHVFPGIETASMAVVLTRAAAQSYAAVGPLARPRRRLAGKVQVRPSSHVRSACRSARLVVSVAQ